MKDIYNYSREQRAYKDSRASPMAMLAKRNTQYATGIILTPRSRKTTLFYKHPNFDLVSLVKRNSTSYAHGGVMSSAYDFVEPNFKPPHYQSIKPMK